MKLTIHVDDNIIRHDINNEQMFKIFPNLPKSKNWFHHKKITKKRHEFFHYHDMKAYETLKYYQGIDFKPPCNISISYFQYYKNKMSVT